MTDKIVKTIEEWRQLLTPEQFYVTREKGTERAFTGKYYNHKQQGIYYCICCKIDLFSSEAKFNSGTGWPSFSEPIAEDRIYTEGDHSHGMVRKEILCNKCDAHLGHLFEDGPPPSGGRHCINSVALEFKEQEE